jgi:hypothetical protein
LNYPDGRIESGIWHHGALVDKNFSEKKPSHHTWVQIGETEDHSFSHFIDANSVRSESENRTAWALFSYANSYKNIKSSMSLIEVDCKYSHIRTLYILDFSEAMGNGRILYGNSIKGLGKWRDVKVGSVAHNQLETLCSLDAIRPIQKS